MSIESPTTFTKNVLICDSLFTGSVETVPTTVSCGIELQSTTTAFCMSRMTTAQMTDPSFIPTNGMIVYNTSTDQFNMYQNDVFAIVNAAAGGTITGPGTGGSTATAVVLWGGTDGDVLTNSLVLIDNAANVTGVNTILTANGTALAPSYAFATNAGTGMYSAPSNNIDFATNGFRQVKIGDNDNAVNYLRFDGSVTGTGVTISTQGGDTDVDLYLVPLGIGLVGVGGNGSAGSSGKVAFYNDAGTNYSAFQAANPGTTVTWTLPSIDATIPGQVLSSNAAGILSWASTGTLSATVIVAAADLLTLNTIPIQIIPAPGAGNMISIVGATMEYVFNITPYTVAAGSQLQLFISTIEVGSDIAATGLLDQGANTFGFTTAANQITGIPTATVANQPLTIKNSSTAFTGGNGTLVVTVYYNIIPV